MTGRGAWSKIGMPPGGSRYYQLIDQVRVGAEPELDADHLAVHYAVLTIQRRIVGLGYGGSIPGDGIFGPKTDVGLRWAQKKLGLTSDGTFGPVTSKAFFWPVVKQVAGAYAQVVGGVCQHESGWDPGAVGFSTPDDHGLVQINQPANPHVPLAQAYSPRFAFGYCKDRIANAMKTYNDLDIAICSYASPLWAKQWFETGHSPNQAMTDYVKFVKTWVSPA